jgi:hypothetical protein
VPICVRTRLVLVGLAVVPPGCQGAPSDSMGAATPAVIAASGDREQRSVYLPAPIDWAGAGDCLDQLNLLHDMAAQGRLEEAHAPPFAVAPATSASTLEWVHSTAVPLVADLPLNSYEDQGAAAAAAPCLLLVEQPAEVHAAHRVADFHTVASEYQSAVRSERNPDYDAAQARLKEAERETKKRGRSILSVGDPMLDLVGLVVGGVIAAFDQVGSHDDLDDALAALKETPRSRDRPVYRAYEFERSTVRAGKEATIEVALHDLRRNRLWRSEVRQREMRELFILEGLDPRDRDYEQHRAGALSREEFEHWKQQPPQLPMSALVAALVEQGGPDEGPPTHDSELIAEPMPSVAPADGLAAADAGQSDATGLAGITALAPSAGPGSGSIPSIDRAPVTLVAQPPAESRAARRLGTAVEPTLLAAALDPRVASVVRLDAGSRRGSGIYVTPRLVVTTTDLVERTSVIDVTTSDGEAALGLVVHTDADRGLALVHVPRAGRPALLSDAAAPASGQTVEVLELTEQGQARLSRAVLQRGNSTGEGVPAPQLQLDGAAATGTGAPVFLNGHAIALVGAREGSSEGNLIPVQDLDELLESNALAALN